MVDSGSDEEVQNNIHLKVKTTSESYDIDVAEKSSIAKVRMISAMVVRGKKSESIGCLRKKRNHPLNKLQSYNL